MTATGKMGRIKNILGITLASLALLVGSQQSRAEDNAENKENNKSFSVKTGHFMPLSACYGEKPVDYSYYRTDLSFEKIFGEKKKIRASLDVSVLNVDNGFGSFYAGPGFSVAYNLIKNERFSAGLKFGWSVFYNDAYKTKRYEERDQRYVGSLIEFDSRLGLDFALNLSKKVDIIVESSVEHISNAGLSNRNEGINTFGFMAGIRKAF